MNELNILIVEDDLLSRIALEQKLKSYGKIGIAMSGEEARAKIKNNFYNIAFVDLDLDRKLEGLTILAQLKEKNVYTIVLSAREEDSIIEKAYQNGCDDYLVKPFNTNSIELVFKKFYQKDLKSSLENQLIEKLHLQNEEAKEYVKLISNSLLSDRPILLTGETGTGKTFLAKLIRDLSGDKVPFVQVNCSEFSETLLESELFGHEKGSFTGAIKNKKGFLELAQDGILFLDEISTMSISLQKKLLKAIEEKEFYPVGGERKIQTKFRLISATCEDLLNKVETGEFRQDLYFRIEGFNIKLKPLRERKNDIENLIKYFIKKGDRRFVIDTEGLNLLKQYSWPGNIRELEKIISVLRTNDKGIINSSDINLLLLTKKNIVQNMKYNLDEVRNIGLNLFIEKLEMDVLEETYKFNHQKVRKTLNDLKISNNAFYRIMDNIKTKANTHAN